MAVPTKSNAMADKPEGARKWAWLVPVVRFPVTRIVLALAALALASFLWLQALLAVEIWVLGWVPQQMWLHQMTLPVAWHLTYVGYVRLVERRSCAELARDGAVRELATGMLVGAALLATVVGLIAVLGFYRVVGRNPWTSLVPPLAVAIGSAYTEEIMFRGVPPADRRDVSGNVAGPPDLLAALRGRPCGQPRCDRRQHGGHHPGGRRAARGRLRPHGGGCGWRSASTLRGTLRRQAFSV